MDIDKKYNCLKEILKSMRSVLIAFSGGVDSTLLLRVSKDVLDKRVLAVTARSATYPKSELNFARKITHSLKARHLVIETKELENTDFRKNPAGRCYFCKQELFSRLKKIARKEGLDFVIDGSNADDRKDFRPGRLALKAMKIRSPLMEAGLGKDEIRILSKRLKLCSWNKPSFACLASRLPYNTEITEQRLNRIEKTEDFIRSLGFRQVRVRDYGSLAKIEIDKKDIPKLVKGYKLKVVSYLKKFGFTYVTVDLEGYRTGSMNEVL